MNYDHNGNEHDDHILQNDAVIELILLSDLNAQILIQVCDIEINWLEYLVQCFNAPFFVKVLVTGPSGCGKTTCINVFVEKLKDEGKKIKIDMVYTEALQPGQLLGFMNKSHG